jgi:hypothetical protein
MKITVALLSTQSGAEMSPVLNEISCHEDKWGSKGMATSIIDLSIEAVNNSFTPGKELERFCGPQSQSGYGN